MIKKPNCYFLIPLDKVVSDKQNSFAFTPNSHHNYSYKQCSCMLRDKGRPVEKFYPEEDQKGFDKFNTCFLNPFSYNVFTGNLYVSHIRVVFNTFIPNISVYFKTIFKI